MAHLIIIGASGFVGNAILKEALNRGHEVKAIVRHPEKLYSHQPALHAVKCDIMDTDNLRQHLQYADGVISAYNPGWTNPDIVADTSKGNNSILQAAKDAGIKRILFVGGAGTLKVYENQTLVDSGALPASVLPAVKAFGDFYLHTLQNEKDIDWVFFSPAGQIEYGKRTGFYKLGADHLIMDEQGRSRISVEDYAKAMIDEYEIPRHHQQRFTIGY